MEHAKVICDVCENAFNGSDLKKHCASIHGVLPNDAFKYQFCPMFFKFEKNLKRHGGSKHDFFLFQVLKKEDGIDKMYYLQIYVSIRESISFLSESYI